MSKTWRSLLGITLLAAGLSLPFLADRDLWAPDEPRYTEVAREMLVEGYFWHPHVNGQIYRDKPPLYFWAELLFSLPQGEVTAFTARLPSALAGILAILLLFDLARRIPLPLKDRESIGAAAAAELQLRSASVASLVLATCWLFTWSKLRVNLDVALSLCALATIWCGWTAIERASRGARHLHLAVAGGCTTALGMMIKGPVILLFVLPALFALGLHPASNKAVSKGRRLALLGLGLGAMAAVLAGWLIPAKVYGGYDVFGIVQEHVVDRASSGRHHIQPFWYFFKTLPADFLPWTFVAPAALLAARTRKEWKTPGGAMLLWWALLPILVLSIIVEKRNVYALPAFPAFAILVGRWAALAPHPSRAVTWGLRIAAVLLAILALAGLVLSVAPSLVPEIPDLHGMLAVLVTLAFGGAIACWRGSRAPAARASWTMGLAFAGVMFGIFVTTPLLNPVKSPRAMGERLAELPSGVSLAAWPTLRQGYVFYSQRYLDTPLAVRKPTGELDSQPLIDWLAQAPRPAYVLSYERYLEDLPPTRGGAPELVFSSKVGHRTAVLLRYDEEEVSATLPPEDGAPSP